MSRIDPHHHQVPGQQPLGRVAILGLGLIGGSLGQVLCAMGASEQVTGWDLNPQTMLAALENAAVHQIADGPCEAVANADLVVICVPIKDVVSLVRTFAPALGPQAVVTDVSSAKSRIVSE